MSNSRVETRVGTPFGELSFEEYFVQRWYQDPVESIRFAGAADAEPAPGVLEAIMNADIVLVAPSNPVTSIGPILAVPGVREALHKTKARIAAVSPIVAGEAVAGPAGILMASQGLPVSIAGVAEAYHDFLDMLVIDTRDAQSVEELNEIGSARACHQNHHAHIGRQGRPGRSGARRGTLVRARLSRGPSTYDPDPCQESERRQAAAGCCSRSAGAHRTRPRHVGRCSGSDRLLEGPSRSRDGDVRLVCPALLRASTDSKSSPITATAEKPMRSIWRRASAKPANSTPSSSPATFRWSRPGNCRAIYDAAPEVGTVLVPAGDNRGTNAVLRRPAALFPLRFGNDSFKPHVAAAKASGKPCVILPLPGLAVDVDDPSDLQKLIHLPGETRAQRLARSFNLRDYPVAVNE